MAAQQGERSKVAMPNDIAYSRKLGPLTPLVGEWEGDVGVDLSYHNKDDWTTETTYFEKASFKPIPLQENGKQTLWGLNYSMTAWRHGEDALDYFHHEIGFLLWDKVRKIEEEGKRGTVGGDLGGCRK